MPKVIKKKSFRKNWYMAARIAAARAEDWIDTMTVDDLSTFNRRKSSFKPRCISRERMHGLSNEHITAW
jgi:hypothetical protein